MNESSMLPVGTILRGTYRIDKYLSSGGFGNTYVGYNIKLAARIAIKEFFMRGVSKRDDNQTTVILGNKDSSVVFAEQMTKFNKEAKHLFRLRNDHIVRVYDLFEENGTAYYVMDYIDGQNLAERLKRTGKPLTEDEVWQLLPQVLDALRCVHNAGLWHLDLKPGNIMVDKDGNAMLIDFGASKQLDKQTGGATASTTSGSYTKGYAPFEQMEQSYKKFGPWTDLYGLGATLYTLLTNKLPPLPSDIDDDDADDKHEALPFATPVSPRMHQLILWMMKTSKSKRPQSAEAVLEFIGQPVGGEQTVKAEPVRRKPVNANPKPATSQPTAPPAKGSNAKTYAILAFAAVCLLGAVAFFLLKGSGGATDETDKKTEKVEAVDNKNVVAVVVLMKSADKLDYFALADKGGGKWEFRRRLPESWNISYRDLTFNIRPTGFKHTGLFPEQAVNWDFMAEKIKSAGREINVLNLFAYTGGATLACAAAGASVCHVDASKGMVQWARDNAAASGLTEKPIRWIVDDCEKFIAREIRRGRKYDAVIMDPPSYGRGPGGEVWKLENCVYDLVKLCSGVLSDEPLFFLINSYTTGLSPSVMGYILGSVLTDRFGGRVSFDEIGLPVKSTGMTLPCGSTAIWEAK